MSRLNVTRPSIPNLVHTKTLIWISDIVEMLRVFKNTDLLRDVYGQTISESSDYESFFRA